MVVFHIVCYNSIVSNTSMINLFFNWYFREIPRLILIIYKGLQNKICGYFNIPFLLKTIFQPWKRDLVVPVNPTIVYYVQSFAENFISRFFGLVIRSIAIITSFIILVTINIIFVVVLVIWYTLLIIIILSFIKGFRGLF